jgi:hypothetical protein
MIECTLVWLQNEPHCSVFILVVQKPIHSWEKSCPAPILFSYLCRNTFMHHYQIPHFTFGRREERRQRREERLEGTELFSHYLHTFTWEHKEKMLLSYVLCMRKLAKKFHVLSFPRYITKLVFKSRSFFAESMSLLFSHPQDTSSFHLLFKNNFNACLKPSSVWQGRLNSFW